MAEKDAKAGKQTVTDEQIVTERKFARRSFLTATGALLAGAVAVASGLRASAQQDDPDKKKPTDPDSKDKKKGSDPDKKKVGDKDQTDKKKMKAKKATDPDKKKASDPDKKKATDPDKKTPPKTDPDGSRF